MISNLTDAEFVSLRGALDDERSEQVIERLQKVPNLSELVGEIQESRIPCDEDFLQSAIDEANRLGERGAALSAMLRDIAGEWRGMAEYHNEKLDSAIATLEAAQ
jgi:hypothetical protein